MALTTASPTILGYRMRHKWQLLAAAAVRPVGPVLAGVAYLQAAVVAAAGVGTGAAAERVRECGGGGGGGDGGGVRVLLACGVKAKVASRATTVAEVAAVCWRPALPSWCVSGCSMGRPATGVRGSRVLWVLVAGRRAEALAGMRGWQA